MNDAGRELRAALERCALADRSDLGRVLATGPDFLNLVHRLSTNTVRDLRPGDARETLLTSPKGRIVDRVLLHHLGDDGVLAITGRGRASGFREHLDRYTFSEETGVRDVTSELGQLALIGPESTAVAAAADLPAPDRLAVAEGRIADLPVRVLGHDGSWGPGLTVLVAADRLPAVRAALEQRGTTLGLTPIGEIALESRRVLLGLGDSEHEFNEDHNPLEAGLLDAIDFEKGCYVGQEVVARLRTYDKVSRRLVGLRFDPGGDPPSPGAELTAGERKAGRVTSAVRPPGSDAAVGLAYVRLEFSAPGTALGVPTPTGEIVARVAELPFVPPSG